MNAESSSYEGIKARLSEIADLVSDESINLEDALSLYEEAAKLGLTACDMSEKDIFPPRQDDSESARDQEAEIVEIEVSQSATSDAPAAPYPQGAHID